MRESSRVEDQVAAAPQVPLAPNAHQYTPLRSCANRLGRSAIPSRTADEILGFNRLIAPRNPNQGLDQEINAYLLDMYTGTDSIAFWQVSLFSNY